nr:peroxide stress protein YaaA [Phytoactinopolyspora mesophila]
MILLPPSEGKSTPKTGKSLNLDALSFPELTAARAEIMDTLMRLCADQPDVAAKTLGLGPTQADEVKRNATLTDVPAAPARKVYAGVLYDALGLDSLSSAAAARARRQLLVISGLWGALRPSDRIPAYRLGGAVTLPGIGSLASRWKALLATTVPEAAGRGLVVDLRSGTYDAFWRPAADVATRTVKVRVLHEHNGKRTVVSHHNKATKGHLVRTLLESGEAPRTPAAFAAALNNLGWRTELAESDRGGRPWTLDVIVAEVATRA